MDSFTIYSAKTSKPYLLHKGQLHVLAVLSQLLYDHFVQPNEVASSHPVGEREIHYLIRYDVRDMVICFIYIRKKSYKRLGETL